MPHEFIEVTKLKHDDENYENTIQHFHITICDSFKKSTFKSPSTSFSSIFEELARYTLTTKRSIALCFSDRKSIFSTCFFYHIQVSR